MHGFGQRPRILVTSIVTSLVLAAVVTIAGCRSGSTPSAGDGASTFDVATLEGVWLGQTPPGDEAQLFAPGIVSTGMFTRDLAATPEGNELYFTVMLPEFEFSAIVGMRRDGVGWTEPEVATFSGSYRDLEPAVAPDGNRLYFASHRPPDGVGSPLENPDLWAVERGASGWGEPTRLDEPINTEGAEFFPSVTRDGTMYFTRRRPDGDEAIYRAELQEDGRYAEPVRLGPEVNAGRARYNAFADPDDRFLIVPIYGLEDSLGATDYYVSFREDDGRWIGPVHLGPRVNSAARHEYSASLDPGGRYLFFMSTRSSYRDRRVEPPLSWADLQRIHVAPENGNPAIYWIDAGFISDLRPASGGS